MARKKIERVGLTTEKYLRSIRGEGVGGGQKTQDSLAWLRARQGGPAAFNPSAPAGPALAPAPGRPPPVAPNPFLQGSLAGLTGGGASQAPRATNPYLQGSLAALTGGGGIEGTVPVAGVRGVGTLTPTSPYLDIRMAMDMARKTKAAEWQTAENAAFAAKTVKDINTMAAPVVQGISAEVKAQLMAKNRAAQQRQAENAATWSRTFSPGFAIQNPWGKALNYRGIQSEPDPPRMGVYDSSGRRIYLNGPRRLANGNMAAKDDSGRDVIYDPRTGKMSLASQGTAGKKGTAQMNPAQVFSNTLGPQYGMPHPGLYPSTFSVLDPLATTAPTAGGGGFGSYYGGGGGGGRGGGGGGGSNSDFRQYLYDLINWTIK